MPLENTFLGTGWSFPPAFGPGGAEVRTVFGVEDIEQSLAVLLATRRGERVMQEDFGCDLSEFLFGEISQGLIGRVRGVIADAILHNEPRITVNEIEVSEHGMHDGLLLISIAYTVRATNSRYNMVFPFYLQEAAVPGG
jgi:phage baseplate assembly protein W